ncbi:asparagine synthase (glutamine-hydrolyzing) [Nostoc sp. PCC 7107]|uniref:asparagine synthase (glutamine-hydrolyzing) n=1 Tax=Nostoc sp. PCC 7107 TaxID=317936 RepID=UPI00029F0DF8|nr:asparagine synthase (glutamine-hydrolyzing) [Nostoc sp. PCC 7107]AFY41482.1 asparagine synthase (glutamine-hydrolyzing) [Nostoc sp. PCC 7107]
MCGIAGILLGSKSQVDASILKSIGHCLSDRGPDDFGFLGWSETRSVSISRNSQTLENSQLYLLHRRLSILDLSEAGWQPMGTANGRYYIVFNGEIYNYLELQTQLQTLGHQFQSHSDTEVLLAAYTEWGVNALSKFVGMFAFAILDTWERTLFLARDFFGIKPLYYTYWQDGIAFASEIKALLQLPGISRSVNPLRVYDYLQSGLTDYGSETLFADIQQLQPSHFLKVSLANPQKPQISRYWQIELNQTLDITFPEATEHLRHLFLESVGLHLRSDVPVGAALSGGIDSSAIVMAMRHLQGNNLQLHTFSYIASEPSLSEAKWVETVAQAAAVIEHQVKPSPEELITDLDKLIELQDEPFGSTSIYAQYRVFQLAKAANIKVMLDGQGADELLGGYRAYLATRFASLLRQGQWGKASEFLQKALKLPGTSQRTILLRAVGLLLPPSLQAPARQLVKKDVFPNWLNYHWFTKHGIEPKVYYSKQAQEILRAELHQAVVENSLPMLLRYEDRNSMAHSIESRVPFLTPAIVNFVFSLPEEFIIANDGTSKAIFREAMRGIVPDIILNRKDKIGFATPEQSWLKVLSPWVENVLNSEMAAQIPALNVQQMQTDFQAVLAGKSAFDFRIWRWVNLIRWAENLAVTFEQ